MDKRQQIFKRIALDNGYCTDKTVVVIENDLNLIYEAMTENVINELEALLETNSTQAYWPAIIKQRINQLKGNDNG